MDETELVDTRDLSFVELVIDEGVCMPPDAVISCSAFEDDAFIFEGEQISASLETL